MRRSAVTAERDGLIEKIVGRCVGGRSSPQRSVSVDDERRPVHFDEDLTLPKFGELGRPDLDPDEFETLCPLSLDDRHRIDLVIVSPTAAGQDQQGEQCREEFGHVAQLRTLVSAAHEDPEAAA